MPRLRDEDGSAPAEFAMVSVLLVVLVLGVVQFALAVYVRNTALDAASEGARRAALADGSLASGAQRTRDLVDSALGSAYAGDVGASYGQWRGRAVVIVTVHAPLPILGLLGPQGALTVTGHAAVETVG